MQQEFNIDLGLSFKEDGIERACKNKRRELEYARSVAVNLALASETRTVSIDQVQAVIIPLGYHLGMAAGGVFREKCWEYVGERKTRRSISHARPISIWRLK